MKRLIEYANGRIKDVEIYIEYNERKEDQDFFAHNELELYKIAKSTLELQNELGCPLDVVFKALKEGIYKRCTYDIGITYIKPQYLSFDGKCFDCSIGDFLDYVNVADYKKTWWLKEDRSDINE